MDLGRESPEDKPKQAKNHPNKAETGQKPRDLASMHARSALRRGKKWLS